MSRVCPACGVAATEDDAFCSSCGTSLEGVADAPAEETAAAAPPTETEEPAATEQMQAAAATVEQPAAAAPPAATTPPTATAPPTASAPPAAAAATAPPTVTATTPPPATASPPSAASAPPSVASTPPSAGAATAVAATTGSIPTALYVALGACALVLISTGLPWFTEQAGGVDSFDVSIQFLWSDTPTSELGIGWAFVALAGLAGIAALTDPVKSHVVRYFTIFGVAVVGLAALYLVRLNSLLEGASLTDIVAIGTWLCLAGGIAALVAALAARSQT